MKFGFSTKLLIGILLGNLLLIGVMAGVSQWFFRNGFENYLNRAEFNRAKIVTEQLATHFERDGNWDQVRRNKRHWINVLKQFGPQHLKGSSHRPPRRPPPPREGYRSSDTPYKITPPPNDRLSFGSRLRLLDHNKKFITGAPSKPHDDTLLEPIVLNEEIVGWLSLSPVPSVAGGLEANFRREQTNAMYMAAAIALFFSILISTLLAKQLLKPIKRLQRGVTLLASGDFTVAIESGPKDDIGILISHVNNLALTLKKNELLRRESMADISHELRTPLSVLRAELEAIQDGVRPCNEERVSSLHRKVLELSKLIDDLYDLTLTDAGALNYRKTSFNLSHLLSDAANDNMALLDKAGLILETHISETLPVFADYKRISQVINNLFKNSYRYTDAGGVIILSAKCDHETLYIDIADSAPSVPNESLNHLFERFYRVEASRNRANGGGGLGLAICKNIIDSHDGTISASTAKQGGLLVSISLPLHR